MKQAVVPIRGLWSARPSVDWALVALVLAAHGVARWRGWDAAFWDLGKDDRMRVYTAVATVSSLLFGFATASIAFFYGSAKGERLDLLKRVMNDQIVRTWRAALSAPLIAVGAAVTCMVSDTRSAGRPLVGWLIEAAIVFLALRAVRLRWMFVGTLGLLSKDIANPSETINTPSGKPPAAVQKPGHKRSPSDVPIS